MLHNWLGGLSYVYQGVAEWTRYERDGLLDLMHYVKNFLWLIMLCTGFQTVVVGRISISSRDNCVIKEPSGKRASLLPHKINSIGRPFYQSGIL